MKPINNFENYFITLDGKVINRTTKKYKKPISNHSGKGYLYVDLYKNGKRHRRYIHRLVAESYIENPENKLYINHKDGNPQNNNVDNLEWCTPLENVEHASKIIKTMTQYQVANERRKMPIRMLNKHTGEEIERFLSIREAERKTNIPSSNIVAMLKGRQAYTGNFAWCYVEELQGV